jgi:hypothetical protein
MRSHQQSSDGSQAVFCMLGQSDEAEALMFSIIQESLRDGMEVAGSLGRTYRRC